MDTEAFLPLHPQDISLEIGRRVQNFADFVDLIVAELAAHHGADLKGLTTGGSQSEYGRYFRLLGFGMFIAYSPRLWARYGETPIWLSVKEIADDEWSITRRVTEGLGQLPPGKFRHVPETESPNTIGIELPLGIEQPDVIAAVIEQVKEVAECCVRWQPNTRKI